MLAGIATFAMTACVVTLEAALDLDSELTAVLRKAGFTGTVESTLERRLGRPVDRGLANLGRLLFFDKIAALRGDNACAGCHAPTAGFGDTQSIAIGVQNTTSSARTGAARAISAARRRWSIRRSFQI